MKNNMNIIINAKGKIGNIYLITCRILGESLLERHIVLAKKLNADKVFLDVPLNEKERAIKIISKYFKEGQYSFEPLSGDKHDLKLDLENVYDIGKAAKVYFDDENLDGSLIWEIRKEGDLKAAEDEYARTKWFPIGRYYIVPMAKAIASYFSKTSVSANQITFISFIVGIIASGLILTGNRLLLGVAGILYLVFWLLDITDGKLARLKREVSDFGKWLDPVVGELIDYLLYLAVVVSLYIKTHNPAILWIGIFYFIGKHITLYLMHTGTTVFRQKNDIGEEDSIIDGINTYSKVAHFIHDADIRKHFMAVALLLNMPAVPLIFYAIYYNAWSLLKCLLEYKRYKRANITLERM